MTRTMVEGGDERHIYIIYKAAIMEPTLAALSTQLLPRRLRWCWWAKALGGCPLYRDNIVEFSSALNT